MCIHVEHVHSVYAHPCAVATCVWTTNMMYGTRRAAVENFFYTGMYSERTPVSDSLSGRGEVGQFRRHRRVRGRLRRLAPTVRFFVPAHADDRGESRARLFRARRGSQGHRSKDGSKKNVTQDEITKDENPRLRRRLRVLSFKPSTCPYEYGYIFHTLIERTPVNGIAIIALI
ncbi:hypothetical protein OG21DRAFT_536339 [Imleria badia]|nr:hypothetical protein OG21DRAFT_536339 [Imleria badia]